MLIRTDQVTRARVLITLAAPVRPSPLCSTARPDRLATRLGIATAERGLGSHRRSVRRPRQRPEHARWRPVRRVPHAGHRRPETPDEAPKRRDSGFCGAIRGRVRRVIWGATCASAPRTPTGNGECEPLVFGGWWAKFDSSHRDQSLQGLPGHAGRPLAELSELERMIAGATPRADSSPPSPEPRAASPASFVPAGVRIKRDRWVTGSMGP